MIKSKKKLLPIFVCVFILSVLCLAYFSLVDTRVYADSPKQVYLVEWPQFNIYTEDSRREDATEAKFGMLLRFDDVLSDNLSEVNGGIKDVNLVEEYGKNIFVNDMPLDFYSYAEICYYVEGYMWIYIPNLSGGYRKLSVKEPFVFKNRTIMPFTLYSALKDGFTYWSSEYVQNTQHVNFKEIAWNNKGYKYFNPKNGLLLRFDKNLSNIQSEFDGGLMEINLVNHGATENAFLGAGKSVSENILLDGVPFKDIEGAEITYHSEGHLWLYVPDMINHTTIEIKANTLFLDSYLPKVKLYSNGSEWVDYDPNTSRDDTTPVSFDKIEWNNSDFGHRDGKNGVLLKFSAKLSKFSNEIDGSISKVNKVNTAIGEHVKLNSVPLKNIAGAEISYHNAEFLWIYIPSEELSVSSGYPHLTIDPDTEFLNAVLPEISLWFDGSYWQENEPNSASYVNNAFDEIKVNNSSVNGQDGYVETVIAFKDKFSVAEDNISRPNFAQIGDAGEKIKVNGKTLNELYKTDDKTNCSWDSDKGLYLLLRKADLFPTAGYLITKLEIASGTKFVNNSIGAVSLYLVDGEWTTEEPTSPSTPIGADTAAPYIYYYGEDEYLVFTGDAVNDFSSTFYAFDERDGAVPYVIDIPTDATTDGKWNKGEWTIKIVATDLSENKCEKEIKVTVINSEEQYLSVYVNGTFSYRVCYGEKIRKDDSEELRDGDPTKEDTVTSYFVFAGWKVNGEFWDFANDVVTEDVWLSPTYKEYPRLFILTVKDTKSNETVNSIVRYGEVIDFSEYTQGEAVYAEVDGTIVKRITVINDIYVELQYGATSGNNGLTMAIIILVGCWLVSAILTAVCVILYKKHGKKVGNN
ncbi:MAG: hypothetical protein IJQ07_07880 [Clostridia bacterium]|nr:hypothetical protein [Clostridia bacterium]